MATHYKQRPPLELERRAKREAQTAARAQLVLHETAPAFFSQCSPWREFLLPSVMLAEHAGHYHSLKWQPTRRRWRLVVVCNPRAFGAGNVHARHATGHYAHG